IYVAKVFRSPLLLLLQHHISAACTAAVLARRIVDEEENKRDLKDLTGEGNIESIRFVEQGLRELASLKQAAHRLKIIFGLAGLKSAELHENLTQAQRLEGLDIMGVQTIINYACSRNLYQEKRAGSKLKSRIVAERSIHKWEGRALIKAEIGATK
ncbi:hypothetical protein S245_051673, partial [Arachis hypogaea]